MTGAFEILSIDLEKKRIGVALLPEGSARGEAIARSQPGITPDPGAGDEGGTPRADSSPAEAFGSLADKLRGALKPRER